MSEIDLLGLTILVVTTFVVTNLDNLIILVFMLGQFPNARLYVLAGFVVSVILVIAVSSIGILIGTMVNPGIVGYLGIAPLAMGVYLLFQQLTSASAKPDKTPSTVNASARIGLTTVVLMFSNSADSIAVLLPLLAESLSTPTILIVTIYLFTSLVWCGLSITIASNRTLAQRISNAGEKLVPWVMVAVGVYVLSNTGTDSLLAGVT